MAGKVKTLYSNREKTEALFPRTKTSAISNEDGVGLDALIENVIYSGIDNPEAAAAPIDADSLGGRLASEYATENFVAVKIAEAQLDGGEVDLSGYATKDDVASAVSAIDFPVDSVNGKAGTVTLSASDVGAAPTLHSHNASDINAGTLGIARGGTGATTAANARTKLGITPTNIGAVAKTELKSLTYNATDENGNITVNLISQYPTTPGVYRVGNPVTGLPNNIIGYGSLIIFNAGEYYLHLYKDAGGGLFHARTDNRVTPVQENWRGIGGGVAWSNASPGSSFGNQTWQSDLSVWTYVAIKFAFHTSLYTDDQYTWWECCPIGFGGTANFTSLGGESYPVTVRRKYSVSKNGVSFGNGGYQQGVTHNLNDNTRAIPMEIYVW